MRTNAGIAWVTGLVALLMTGLSPASGSTDTTAGASGLSGTYWWVEDIGGAGVVDRSHTTMGFLPDARVVGDSGCNRYQGAYHVAGTALQVGPLAGTRRACPDALMRQEQRFYDAMRRVAGWRIEPTGLLWLLDEAGQPLIRAVAVEQDTL